jgi:hypothetical protein
MHCKSSGQELQWQDDSRKLDIAFDGTHMIGITILLY